MNTMRRLAWLALLVAVICSVFSMFHTDAQELNFEVFAPAVQKAHIESTPTPAPTPTPTITPTPWRPPPTPIPACDCSGDLYNCTDFTTQVAAQACFDYCMQEVGYDVHKLDRDEDGIACEWLP